MSSQLGSVSRSGSESSLGFGGVSNVDFVQESILGLDAKSLLKALQDVHAVLNSVKAENLELRRELASLHCKPPQGQGKVSTSSNPSSNLSVHDEEITKLGKVFVHLFSLWINPGPPSPSCTPRPPFKWNNQDWYLDFNSIASGQTTELYACVPLKFHKYMEKHERFQELFMESVSSGRSNMLLCARSNAALIFNMKSTLFESNPKGNENRMANNPELACLLGFKPNGRSVKERYPSSPPILFTNENINAIDSFLKNRILISMACLLAYGPRALNCQIHKLVFNRNSPLHGHVQGATFGFICVVAIIVRFLLGGDPEMNKDGIGKLTHVNYFSEAEAYKKRLIENQDSPFVRKLLDYWNTEVFPSFLLAPDSQDEEEDLVNDGLVAEEEDTDLDAIFHTIRLDDGSSHTGMLSDELPAATLPD